MSQLSSCARLACIALVCGCGSGSGSGAGPGFRSGSRLRAHFYDGGNGARRFVNFHDRVLDIDCWFMMASDGSLRCVPSDTLEVVYADAGCTQPLALSFTRCDMAMPGYAGRFNSSTPTAAYRVGALQPSAPFFRQTGVASCVLQGSSAGLHAVQKVDASEFVGITSTRVAHGEVGTEYYAGDDGSRLAARLYDVARDTSCDFQNLTSGPRCIGGHIGFDFRSFFADAQCTTTPVAFSFDGAFDAILGYDASGCGAALYDLGNVVPADSIWQGHGTFCQRWVGAAGPYYTIGPERSPDPYPVLRMTTVGNGGTVVEVATTAAGEFLDLPVVGLARRGSSRPCNFIRAADGRSRCVDDSVPQLHTDTQTFADAGCTQPIVATYASSCAAAPTFGVYVAFVAPCSSLMLDSAFTLGPPVDVATVFMMTASGCTGQSPSAGAVYRAVGAAADLSLLPVVEDKIE